MRRSTGVGVTYIRHRMAPRSTRQTGRQRRLGGNARSFLSCYIVVSLTVTPFLVVTWHLASAQSNCADSANYEVTDPEPQP